MISMNGLVTIACTTNTPRLMQIRIMLPEGFSFHTLAGCWFASIQKSSKRGKQLIVVTFGQIPSCASKEGAYQFTTGLIVCN